MQYINKEKTAESECKIERQTRTYTFKLNQI